MALDFDHAQKQSPSTLLVIDDLLPARCFRFRETVCAWQGDKTRKFETETRVTILVTVCGPDNPGNENARSGNASYRLRGITTPVMLNVVVTVGLAAGQSATRSVRCPTMRRPRA